MLRALAILQDFYGVFTGSVQISELDIAILLEISVKVGSRILHGIVTTCDSHIHHTTYVLSYAGDIATAVAVNTPTVNGPSSLVEIRQYLVALSQVKVVPRLRKPNAQAKPSCYM